MARPYNVPKKELQFAAKSGFLTKKIWKEFFSSHRQSWSNDRWRGFKSRKLFLKHGSPLLRDCLVLNKGSPDVRSIIGEQISSPPPASQIHHDELVAGIVLRLLSHGYIDGYYLEPEIRRIQQDNEVSHRRREPVKLPDAVFDLKVDGTPLRVALEMEISIKSQIRYKKIIESYSASRKIERIVIVYRGARIKNSFERAVLRHKYLKGLQPLFFIDFE